ncbi:metal-dependent hydrolase [Vibrio parahaemolyticus]|uniref:metal-dependent hydrolase n=1 Tax=Vibrio parahaemolyticus TaxID=670 RepID=UPI003D817B4C
MNKVGHTYGAILFAPLPAIQLLDVSPIHSAIAALACISCGNLPDRLEFGTIPHRTITHILSIWLAIAIYGYLLAASKTTIPIEPLTATSSIVGAILCGCGAGGVSHWLGDVFNKQAVPVFTPFDTFALYLFKSGSHQRFTCGFISLVAWFFVLLLRELSFRTTIH